MAPGILTENRIPLDETPEAKAEKLISDFIKQHADQVTAELLAKKEEQIAQLKAQKVPDIITDDDNPWYEIDEDDDDGWTEEIGGRLIRKGVLSEDSELDGDRVVEQNEHKFGSTDTSDLVQLEEIATRRRE